MRPALLLLAALVLLPASNCEEGSTDLPADREITIRGRLTDEGEECPTLRDRNNRLFSLSGSVESYKVGDRVCVRGHIIDTGTCPEGVTLTVEWIGYQRFCP